MFAIPNYLGICCKKNTKESKEAVISLLSQKI